MPSATRRGTIKVDQALTDFSVKYSNIGHIADIVSPRIKVAKDSDVYFVYGKNDFRVRDDLRAAGAPPNYVDSFSASTAAYQCVKRSLSDKIPMEERENADPAIDPAFSVVESLSAMLSLGREKRVADLYTATASWATGHNATLTTTMQWNHASFDSDSKTDAIKVRIDTAKEKIRSALGVYPNAIVIPPAITNVMTRDSEIQKLVQYTDSTLLINGDLPPVLWNLKVFCPGAIYDSAQQGQAFSGADVWGKHVVLLYMAPSPKALRTFTAGLTMESKSRYVTSRYEDEIESDIYDTTERLIEKIVCTDAGYVIRDVIA